jgi:hypothetical protein
MKKDEKAILSIYTDKKTIQEIEKEAKKQRRSLSFVAKDILDEWIKKIKK